MKLIALSALFIMTIGCRAVINEDGEFPDGTTWTHKCYQEQNAYGQYYLECNTYYNSFDQTILVERDIAEEVSDIEGAIVASKASFYEKRFTLSADAAYRLAKLTEDFKMIQERSMEDVADYAQRLYGVNPNKIIEAIANAQVGDNTKLDEVISEGARNFGTTDETMRAVVNHLHFKRS